MISQQMYSPTCYNNLNCHNFGAVTGNLSKWAFAPTGCAFIWTHPIHRAHMTEIKHLFRGDRETSKNQFIMAKSSLDFIERLGGLVRILSKDVDV